MIRVLFLVVASVLTFLLYRANEGNMVALKWVGGTSAEVSLFILLVYAFVAGALGHFLFILPERVRTWRDLRAHRRSLKKMGKSLGNVIAKAKSHDE